MYSFNTFLSFNPKHAVYVLLVFFLAAAPEILFGSDLSLPEGDLYFTSQSYGVYRLRLPEKSVKKIYEPSSTSILYSIDFHQGKLVFGECRVTGECRIVFFDVASKTIENKLTGTFPRLVDGEYLFYFRYPGHITKQLMMARLNDNLEVQKERTIHKPETDYDAERTLPLVIDSREILFLKNEDALGRYNYETGEQQTISVSRCQPLFYRSPIESVFCRDWEKDDYFYFHLASNERVDVDSFPGSKVGITYLPETDQVLYTNTGFSILQWSHERDIMVLDLEDHKERVLLADHYLSYGDWVTK